ncbi:MAG TPA: helix-turn-helix transcriptional regulator [Ruminiclostridium sp.]|nr:helix-turn-helix transcriptional regulator [Ruminiclostridium sp.]
MNNSLSAKEFIEKLVPNRPKHRKLKTKLLFDISSRILDYRLEKSMSQKSLAEFFGVTQGMISKWESCEYNFTIEQVCKIAEKLDLIPNITFSADEETAGSVSWQNIKSNENIEFIDENHIIPMSA